MNSLLNGLKNETNFTITENGALTHKSTNSALLDMFAMGGAMRNRDEEDIILMFKNAFLENPTYAMKCLFYLGDCRGGQGERRFFRVCAKWLAKNHPDAILRNLNYFPVYRRWDDLYCLVDTPLEDEAFAFVKRQLSLDVQCKVPSLLAKWLKSENASSVETHRLANKTREYLGMTHKQYRKTLSILRERINIVEKLMSENKWDKIEFDKIPSRAGLIYRNAFARHDYARYNEFALNRTTKVNASVLNPVDIAEKILYTHVTDETERAMYDKYWNNLKDYYNGRTENAIAICDVSGSMYGTSLAAAVSMSAYIAEKSNGFFKDYFMTFSQKPDLVKFEGIDIVDKFLRAKRANWGFDTNIEAAMNLLLDTAVKNNVPKEEMPTTFYIFSDMEFNKGLTDFKNGGLYTVFEKLEKVWEEFGYELPRIIFWNLDARHENIPALGDRFSYVSGFSMNMVDCILGGKDGYDLMMEKLNSSRYEGIC